MQNFRYQEKVRMTQYQNVINPTTPSVRMQILPQDATNTHSGNFAEASSSNPQPEIKERPQGDVNGSGEKGVNVIKRIFRRMRWKS
jgi:hypothetical protein